MDKNQISERINELRAEVIKNDRLYEQNVPVVSDTKYDEDYMELVKLELENPEFDDVNSPTQMIYNVVVTGLKKVTHLSPMLSQDKVNCEEDLLKFLLKSKDKVIIEHKLDGLTIVLTYINGKLVMAVTRGDGYVGQDVIHTVRTIKSVPKSIKFKGRLEIRIEVIIPTAEFERINVNGEYRSARNLASGTVGAFDASIAKKRNLRGIAFDLISAEDMDFNEDLEMLRFMHEQGFDVVPYEEFECTTQEEINKLIEYCLTFNDNVRKTLEYGIDGLVLKFNNLSVREDLGYTSKFPRWGCAFKFEALEAITKVKRIYATNGKTGQQTPNVEFDPPVIIDGSLITFATLNNYSDVKRKDVRVGDTVIVAKGNDVIPKVVCVLKELRTGEEIETIPPTHCADCGAITEFDGAHLYCTGLNCKGQISAKLRNFVSRTAMNINGLGDKTVTALYEKQFIFSVVDIYKMEKHRDALCLLKGFGLKGFDKMIAGAEESKKQPLSKVLAGLSIRNVGESTSKDLAKEFVSMQNILDASADVKSFEERLIKIKDVGTETTNSVVVFFSSEENKKVIEEMLSLGLEMKEAVKLIITNDNIVGKTFVITGTFSVGREVLKEKIESMGGKTSGSVSKKTDYLLFSPDAEGSGKHDKAIELGTKLLTEQDFNNMIE